MPRHIEQPALRHSKPAARKTSSRPSSSACAFTCCGARDDHRADARRRPCARRPSTAAARRSPIRELVHEPMNTRSSAMSVIGVPGSQRHVGERALGGLAVGRRAPCPGSGTASVTWTTMPGLVPQVTIGEMRRGVDLDLGVELRALVGRQLAPARRRPRRSPRGRRGARRPTRRSSRPGRSCPRDPRPRWSCCRSSSGSPSRGPDRRRRRTRPRDRPCRSRPGGRWSPGSGPWR